jgi:hypothetical protein
MGTLNDLRRDIAVVLEAALFQSESGVTVYRYVPESPATPFVYVSPDDPFLSTEDEPFGHFKARFIVRVAAEVGTNEKATDDLDNLIEAVIEALQGHYVVEEVREPFAYQTNTAMHLATDLSVSDSIRIT